GDEVLRRVGQALQSAVRPYDLIARYGGDEFAIVTIDAGEEQAAEVARRAITRLEGSLEDIRVGSSATATAGVAAWAPGLSPSDLVAEADRALLFGKQEGRSGQVIDASSLPGLFRPGRFRRRTAETAPIATTAPWPAEAGEETERLRKRSRSLALATVLGTRLSALNDPRAITRTAVEELHRAFGYFLTCVVRLREDGYVEAAAEHGPALSRVKQRDWAQPADTGVIGRCLVERVPVIQNDVLADPDYVDTPETISVRSELCVPLWVGEELWGAIDVEENEADAFDEDDARLVQTVADQVGSALRSALLYERLEAAYLETAEVLAGALEAKDSGTAALSRSIAENAVGIGRRLGMTDAELETLRLAALFHDIGKLAVPEAILTKPGPLTPEERELVEVHAQVGGQILAPVEFLREVVPIVIHEHERFDGNGYPDGLKGEDIPLGSRIILACDAYHAMISERPYRAPRTHGEAVAELKAGSGSQFDPRVVVELVSALDPPGGR
nr:diguanylate cyclase [Thermoleophilaceae bacterium]